MSDELPRHSGSGFPRSRSGPSRFRGGDGARVVPPGPYWPRTVAALVVVLLALMLLVLPLAATRWTDWLWYREIGFERVFLLKIVAQWTLGAIVGVGSFLLFWLNGRAALRGVHIEDALPLMEQMRQGVVRPAAVLERLASAAMRPVALVLAALAGLVAAGE